MHLLAFVGCDLAGTGVSWRSASRTMKTSPAAAKPMRRKSPIPSRNGEIFTRNIQASSPAPWVTAILQDSRRDTLQRQYGRMAGSSFGLGLLNNKMSSCRTYELQNLDPVSGRFRFKPSVLHVVVNRSVVLTLRRKEPWRLDLRSRDPNELGAKNPSD